MVVESSRICGEVKILCFTISAGRSPAEIVGSNPTGGMDICLL